MRQTYSFPRIRIEPKSSHFTLIPAYPSGLLCSYAYIFFIHLGQDNILQPLLIRFGEIHTIIEIPCFTPLEGSVRHGKGCPNHKEDLNCLQLIPVVRTTIRTNSHVLQILTDVFKLVIAACICDPCLTGPNSVHIMFCMAVLSSNGLIPSPDLVNFLIFLFHYSLRIAPKE